MKLAIDVTLLLPMACNNNSPILQAVFTNRAEHVCATVMTKHSYMVMCSL